MSMIKVFLWRWGPAVVMMAVIYGFSSIPSGGLPNFGLVDFLVKKGGHALGYALLALAFLRGLKGNKRNINPRWLYMAWGLAVLFSTTDEFHQSFVPGRHPMATDVLIDSGGAAIALVLAYRYYKQKNGQTI